MKIALRTLVFSALSVLSAGPVLAGEDIEAVPAYTETLQPLPFAGAYIGATVGWVRADADQTVFPLGGDSPPPPVRFSSDDDGWALGGHVGYNWQRGRLVYGFETDLSWMDVDPSRTLPFNLPSQAGETLKTSYDYFGTVRGRLGWAHENLLIYGTGGYAYAGLDHTFVAPVLDFRQSDSDVKSGWTAGGGIELARGHWSLRAEALYVDLHDTTITYVKPGCPECTTRIRWDDDFVVARVGFSVKLHHDEPRYEPLK